MSKVWRVARCYRAAERALGPAGQRRRVYCGLMTALGYTSVLAEGAWQEASCFPIDAPGDVRKTKPPG